MSVGEVGVPLRLLGPLEVIPAIAQAVHVAAGSGPFSTPLDLLRGRDQLLLLDNVEHLRGAGTVETLTAIDREHADLVAAVEWSLASGRPDRGGWLGWHLWLFRWVRGPARGSPAHGAGPRRGGLGRGGRPGPSYAGRGGLPYVYSGVGLLALVSARRRHDPLAIDIGLFTAGRALSIAEMVALAA